MTFTPRPSRLFCENASGDWALAELPTRQQAIVARTHRRAAKAPGRCRAKQRMISMVNSCFVVELKGTAYLSRSWLASLWHTNHMLFRFLDTISGRFRNRLFSTRKPEGPSRGP